MTLSYFIAIGIVLAVCCIICYAKGYRDRRKDEQEEGALRSRYQGLLVK